MTKNIIIIGTLLAIGIIIIRYVCELPLFKHMRESFSTVSRGAPPSCPPGSKFYMYNGTAHCCSGTIDKHTANIQKSCRPAGVRDELFTFCTLGAATPHVKNCYHL